ncbi:diketogulonate reductase-like aldo/keto reductase [Psychrobacter immobilis]|uniref:Diketogulonate reductase-like aldo/keto reductase n=1 Tax=Psychrobacter immobilis TaxID=498 RepID=A0A2V1ZKZ0_PSYIM|nr:aldo/keto reductase [Psychrobacter immobilis]MDN5560856.1 aldo/keto reductase [Psychrobacter sp.]PWK08869.1 diketogulonate reductase-like aldo/keto reductase [Psychrobacter immobilis]
MRAKTYNIRTAGQANIPVLGLGTWQSTGQDCVDVVSQALKMGYEHIDTAQAYGNEKEVAQGIKQSGVSRDKFFLTTKIFPDDMKFEPEKLIAAAKRSLADLDTDYVDLLLLHWPDDRVPLSETIPALCELQKQGLTRHIGVSNFNIANIIEAEKYADVPIVVNQVEFHPFIKQKTLQTFLNNHHILLEAYSPLARGDVFDNEIIKEIADKHNVTPAQISLAWILADKHRIAIPKTSNPDHLQGNLDAIKVQLSADDIEKISSLARADGRKIKHPDYSPEWDD